MESVPRANAPRSSTAFPRGPNLLMHAVVLIAVFACLLAFAWFKSHQGENESPHQGGPGRITVIGDSITSLYDNEPGSARQGWWSIVGHQYDSYVRTFAQQGSGYLRPGHECSGTRFDQRLHALSVYKSDLVIVEGGRNDWIQCREGAYVRATDDSIRQAVFNYLSDVDTLVSPSTPVLVLGPVWGPRNPREQARVESIVRAGASHFGMQFVPMDGILTPNRVVDGVHPNLAGSRAIAEQVIEAIERAEH